jgi:medium-chain acyl-[acyl-carrier-protein] hydrolase
VNPSPWFVTPRVDPNAEFRLFIFPYAGGSPAAFNKWTIENIGCWTAHYPGRGSRHSEALIKNIPSLVEPLSQAIHPLLDKPFAFFGHSMGAVIAFELARSLRRNNLPQPKFLFVSACGAPHIPDPHPPIYALPDDEFLAALQKLNGVPSELLHQPEVMQLLLPIVRADFEAIETYQYISEHPLEIPIIAIGGSHDPRVSRERLEGWSTQTSAVFKSRTFDGDHFFIHTEKETILDLIREKLT